MININPTDPLTLDRENLEAIDQSTQQQWSLIQHLLHLPDIANLHTVDAREIAGTIANRIHGIRGGITSIPRLQSLLERQYKDDKESAAARAIPKKSPAHSARTRNIQIADAWLKTIFAHFEEGDIRALSQDLSLTIRPANGSREWESTAPVLIDGASQVIAIDLDHPAWSTGTVDQIRQRITNQRPQDVGIRATHRGRLSIGEVDIILDQAQCRIVDVRTNNVRNATLTEALNARAPLENLLVTTTDNRELMLALATAQRDPSALDAIAVNQAEIENITQHRSVAEAVMSIRAYQPIALPPQIAPDASFQVVQNDLRTLRAEIARLRTEQGSWHTQEFIHQQRLAADQRALERWRDESQEHRQQEESYLQAEQAYQDRIFDYNRALAAGTAGLIRPRPHSRVRPGPRPIRPRPTAALHIFSPITIRAPFSSTISSIDELRTKIIELEGLEHTVNYCIHEFEDRSQTIVALYQLLQELRIQNINTTFPTLHSLVTVGANVVIDPNALRANSDWAAVIQEIERNFPGGLKSVEDYTNDLAKARIPKTGAWAVVERGLEHQGLHGKELESTLQYMRAQVQRTPESIRDRRSLAEAEFSYDGDENKVARKQYNEGKGYFGFPRILFPATNPYKSYKKRIFTQKNIGLTLKDNPFERRFPLPRLLDAYCRTKYLMGLPISDPRSLPYSQEIVTFMRRLHEAILERSQESFNYASGMSNAEIMELRAKSMDIDAARLRAMTPTERMQFVQDYLHNPQAYIERNKTTIEKIADRAYRPIKKDLEGHQRHWNDVKFLTKGTGKVLWYATGAFAVAPVAKFATNKVVKPLWKNKGSMALGAVAGTFFMPVVGTAIGAAVAPWIKRKFFATK